MYILKNKRKNGIVYSLAQSSYNPETKRNTSTVVERLGTEEEIKKKIGNKVDFNKWLKDYAKKKTEEQKKQSEKSANVEFKYNQKTKAATSVVKNAGYLYIKKVLIKFGLDKTCSKIEKKEQLKYDLFTVFSNYLYTTLCATDYVSTTTYQFANTLLQNAKFKYSDTLDAIKIISKYSGQIQKEIYENIQKLSRTDRSLLFYTCSHYSIANTNIHYMLYGYTDNSLVSLMHLFFDSNGYIAKHLLENSFDKIEHKESEIKNFIHDNFADAELYILPDCDHSVNEKTILDLFKNGYKLQSNSISSLPEETQEWIMEPDGWFTLQSKRNYNSYKVFKKIEDPNTDYEEALHLSSTVFYKQKTVDMFDPNTKEIVKQNLMIAYVYNYDQYKQSQRRFTIANIKASVERKIRKTAQDKYSGNSKLVKSMKFESDGEEDPSILYFDQSTLRQDEMYDGLYAFSCVSDKPIKPIRHTVYMKIDCIDYLATFCRADIKNQSDTISYDEALNAYHLINVIAYNVINYLVKNSKYKVTFTEIMQTINNIKFCKIENVGWKALFVSNKVIDELKDATGLNLNYDFIDYKEMQNLVK